MTKRMDERRKFIRLEVPIELKYICENQANAVRWDVMTKNISCDGVRFISDFKMDEGAVLDIDLNIPKAANPVHIKGRIIWVKKISDEGDSPYDVGVEFVQIEEDNKNTFLKYLCDLIYDQTRIIKAAN